MLEGAKVQRHGRGARLTCTVVDRRRALLASASCRLSPPPHPPPSHACNDPEIQARRKKQDPPRPGLGPKVEAGGFRGGVRDPWPAWGQVARKKAHPPPSKALPESGPAPPPAAGPALPSAGQPGWTGPCSVVGGGGQPRRAAALWSFRSRSRLCAAVSKAHSLEPADKSRGLPAKPPSRSEFRRAEGAAESRWPS